MKRSRLGTGAKSLQRGSTFNAPPRQLKRRRAHRDTTPRYWRALTRGSLDGSPVLCACGCGRPADHGHHIIYAQVLARHGLPLYTKANHMPLAAECHAAHHNASRRLRLPPGHPVWSYAEAHGLTWWLERTYGEAS